MKWPAVAALLALLLIGCAPDPPLRSGSPVAGPPDVDSRLRSLGSGAIELSLDPGQATDLDPLSMAINLGITPPPCADFVMLFTWQVRRPDPAGDAKIGFWGERMGGRFEVAAPASSGEASIGCALLETVSMGPTPVVVQLRFVVATPKR